jgi:hypothetical protein
MKTDTPFVVTEWEWFRLKLDLYALQRRADSWSFLFGAETPGKLTCSIWYAMVQQLVDAQASRARQLEFYANWVEVQKQAIRAILQGIPTLRTEFDVDRDVVFEILYDYGMGSYVVCEFDAQGVQWRTPA